MNPIKVIYILDSPSKHGGANKSFANMLEGLVKEGVIPFVVIPSKGWLSDELENRGIPCYFINFYLSIYPPLRNIRDIILFLPRFFRTLYVNLFAIGKLIKLANVISPNLIHSNLGPIHIGYKVASKLKIPHIWHIREYQDLDFNMHPLFSMKGFIKKLNNPNNYCIAITRNIYNYFSLKNNATMIYNGVLEESRVQFNVNKKKYFLFAGRLEENKGIRSLIIAFSEFAKTETEYQFLIAGNTLNKKYEKTLLALVEKFGMKDRIIFLGMRDDINDLMASATAIIVSSLNEGFGRITAEAMFNGCLVIGNNTGGTKEQLENGIDIGLPYKGHKELVNVLNKVVEIGIEKFYPMILRGQKTAISLYSQEQNAKSVYQLYRSIFKFNL